jgi:exo-beta-1,3-glucanase (GH17 family)
MFLLLNVAAWRAFNPPHAAPEAPARVHGLAYNAFQRWDSPLTPRFPTETELAADLRLLAGLTGRLRTYSALEFPTLPSLAQQFGLRLSLGVWLDERLDNNEREIAAALDAVRQHAGVERVIAGNETQVHHRLSLTALYAHLDRLRAALPVPVSTAEPWHIWLSEPALADHVDFITVHLLPYWEGVPMAAALDEALRRYDAIRARFPDQPIVIGEIGWPRGGPADKLTRPGGVVDLLTEPGGLLDRISIEGSSLERMLEPGGLIDRLLEEDGPLERMFAQDGIVERMFADDGIIDKLTVKNGPLEQLTETAEILSRLQPAVETLTPTADTLESAVDTLNRMVTSLSAITDRIPRRRPRSNGLPQNTKEHEAIDG